MSAKLPTKKLRELSLASFYFFALGILGYDYMVKHVHYDVCSFLGNDEKQEKMLLLPRGFLKTTLGSVALPMWLAMKNPNIRILIVSNTITNAANHLRKIKSQFQTNQFLRTTFPDRIPNMRKERWTEVSATIPREVTGVGEGTFECAGVGTNLPSRHYDRIIEDDTVTATKDSVTDRELNPSQVEIDKAIGFHRLLPSLFDTPDKGYTYVIATRWAQHDIVQWIKENEPYYSIYEQNIYKDNDIKKQIPIYPERFSAKSIEKLKVKQGPYIFSTQYILKPIPSEMMIFRPEWLQYYEELPRVRGSFFAYVDPASADSKDACHTAIIVIFCTPDHKIYIVEVVREIGLSITETTDHIFRIHKQYHPKSIGIETVGYQEQLAKYVRERMRKEEDFFPITDDRPKRGEAKGTRIEHLQPRFAAKQFYLKVEHAGLRADLLDYQGVEKSKYVDTLDALAGAVKLARFPQPSQVDENVSTGRTMMDALNELWSRNKSNSSLPMFGDRRAKRYVKDNEGNVKILA